MLKGREKKIRKEGRKEGRKKERKEGRREGREGGRNGGDRNNLLSPTMSQEIENIFIFIISF